MNTRMQVVSLAPVPVASLKWRLGDGAWTLSVICKLTLQLAPGDAEIAKRHDPIYEHDKFPDDDTEASLFAPSDLMPNKPLVDVMVVGNVYAPRGSSAATVRARLHVLSIDKALTVDALGDHTFRSAPLGYEYAEAGPTNPIGVRGAPSGRDASHTHRISQEPDPSITNPGFTSPGFGPIAAHWLSRRSLLRGHREPAPIEGAAPLELPADFDLGFFNAAPADQQLPELAPNCELLLEHLHPEHGVLRTRLPNVAPQFFVERGDPNKREEVNAHITSLWIDSRRSVATLTFHGKVKLEDRDEKGRLWVAVAGPGRRLTGSQLAKLIGSLSRSQHGTPLSVVDEATADESADPLNRTVSIRKASQLPVPREDTLTSVLSASALYAQPRRGDPRETTGENQAPPHDGLPAWLSAPPSLSNPASRESGPKAPRSGFPPPSGDAAPAGVPTGQSQPNRPTDGTSPKESPPPAASRTIGAGDGQAIPPSSDPQGPDAANPRQRATTSPGHGAPAKTSPPPRRPSARPPLPTQHGLGPMGVGPGGGPRPEWPSSHRARSGDRLAETSSLPRDAPGNPLPPGMDGARPATTAPGRDGSARQPMPNAGAVRGDTEPPPAASAGPPPPPPPPPPHSAAHPRVAVAPNVAPPSMPLAVAPPTLQAQATTTRAASAVVVQPAASKPEPKRTPRRVPTEVVELLWYEDDATERLRKRWRKLTDELAFAPKDDQHDLATADPRKARAHHIHFGVLTEAPAANAEALRRSLRDAISETGRFTPPLVLLSGTLRFPFDEIAALRATHAVLKPIAGDDKKLRAALAQVEEILESPLLSGSAETVSNYQQILRKRYDATRRTVTLEYLDETVDRMLLEQRRYQKRTLLGGEKIRALLTLHKSDKAMPAYLPIALDKQLPLLQSMHVRVIAEVHVKQDQYEPNAHALRVVTLGRVIKVEA